MARLMYHDQPTQPTHAMKTRIYDQAEVDKLIAEAYAKGRSETFTFLGLDETDFPEGEGAEAWCA